MSRKSLTSVMSFEGEPKVLVWGLNDKDQLGGLKGSKVKMPVLSETLSSLHPVHVAGGSKSLFVVSQEGKVRREHLESHLSLARGCAGFSRQRGLCRSYSWLHFDD